MRHRYYYESDADGFADAVVHRSRQCADFEGDPRPLATSTVENSDIDQCPTCCDVPETDDSVADSIDAGDCPWCDDYEGEHVGRHASSAHPNEWTAHREG